ncbi:MAG TPA: hypothetical protein VJ917_04785 [Saprospiraceae bacterium]|nr:hypothetical protein [Saprospiraceae bacterium]
MRRIACSIFLLFLTFFAQTQNTTPIWDIGTKWTYSFSPLGRSYTSLTNEIIDTTRINGLKLYVVESFPNNSGIRYFYFENDLVFNYNERSGRMTLLYNFSEENSYGIEDLPICDPTFPYDSLAFKNYHVHIDSMGAVEAENGTVFQVQHVNVPDTLYLRNDTEIIPHKRSIIENIGFAEGGIHYTHHWEIGGYICDEFANYVDDLRCFEQNGTVYNFVGYPCDSSWIISNSRELSQSSFELYPNPAEHMMELKTFQVPEQLMVRDVHGNLLMKLEHVRSIPVYRLEAGYYFLEILLKDGHREIVSFIKK